MLRGFEAAQRAWERRCWTLELGDCAECDGENCVTLKKGGRGYYWWRIVHCLKCGHLHQDDNFDETND